MSEQTPLISVRNLCVSFEYEVVSDVSFDVFGGEICALMGESGCGKSVSAMSILRLLPVPSAKITKGSIIFNGKNLLEMPLKEFRKIRGAHISCVFQEPMQALNPVITIGKQLLEVAPIERVKSLLAQAGFDDMERVLKSFPHELSGGMLQRIVICIALAKEPELLIADEPTTALDVNIQAQVMDVLQKMAKINKTAILLITHNAALAAKYADRIMVMYAGKMVECGTCREIIGAPAHPYTKSLFNVVPAKGRSLSDLKPIPGSVPHPKDFDNGCRFRFRCSSAKDTCAAPQASIESFDKHSSVCGVAV